MELIRHARGVMAYQTVVRNSMHAVCAMAMAQLALTSWKLNRKPSRAAILMFWYLVLVLTLVITHYVCYTTTLAEKWSSTQQVLQTFDMDLSMQTMRKRLALWSRLIRWKQSGPWIRKKKDKSSTEPVSPAVIHSVLLCQSCITIEIESRLRQTANGRLKLTIWGDKNRLKNSYGWKLRETTFFCKGKELYKTSKRENLVTWHKFTLQFTVHVTSKSLYNITKVNRALWLVVSHYDLPVCARQETELAR